MSRMKWVKVVLSTLEPTTWITFISATYGITSFSEDYIKLPSNGIILDYYGFEMR